MQGDGAGAGAGGPDARARYRRCLNSKREIRAVQQRVRFVALSTFVLALAFDAVPAQAKEAKRYGIRGVFLAWDEARNVFKIDVKSNEAPNFGGSTAGDKAPADVEIGKEMELTVKPEGSVLSRTVIKSTKGTGLDNSGTLEGFRNAVGLIPKDRPVVLSIEKNNPAADGAPPYRLQTVFIPLSDEEIERRIKEFTEGKDGE
jgi:hypothetical protein